MILSQLIGGGHRIIINDDMLFAERPYSIWSLESSVGTLTLFLPIVHPYPLPSSTHITLDSLPVSSQSLPIAHSTVALDKLLQPLDLGIPSTHRRIEYGGEPL